MGRPFDRCTSIMAASPPVVTNGARRSARGTGRVVSPTTPTTITAAPPTTTANPAHTTPFLPSPPLSSVFQFTAGPLPGQLVFTPSSLARPAARKRCRPLDDVDGEHSSQSRKKKRRLRLFLITSRLSPVFSQPATYIVDRGSSKIAVWAKQRALGRNLLRKAAIMNCKRQRERQLQNHHQQQQAIMAHRQVEMARQTFMYGSHDTLTHPVMCAPRAPFPREPHSPSQTPFSRRSSEDSPKLPVAATATGALSPNFSHCDTPVTSPLAPPLLVVRGPYVHHPSPSAKADDGASAAMSRKPVPPSAQVPRRDYIPLPPSPLGLSNYDALDLEDEFPMTDVDDGNDGDDDASSFNSSFSSTFSSGPGEGWASLGRNPRPSASPPTIYSDFSVLDPMESVVDDYDLIEAFAGTSTTAGVGALEEAKNEAERRKEAERKREEERMEEIRAEKERQREVFRRLNDFVVT